MPITLLITNDSKIIVEAWKYIFGLDNRFQVIATCTSGEKAVEHTQMLRPDIVIMDNNMPGISGIEATAMISNSVPETKVLGFSMNSEAIYAEKFMAAGAAGYTEKTASIEKMTQTLIHIHHSFQLHAKKIRNAVGVFENNHS